jgi:hypothetical protein
MIPCKILKKIRQSELRTSRIVTETFACQGMDFDEVAEP